MASANSYFIKRDIRAGAACLHFTRVIGPRQLLGSTYIRTCETMDAATITTDGTIKPSQSIGS